MIKPIEKSTEAVNQALEDLKHDCHFLAHKIDGKFNPRAIDAVWKRDSDVADMEQIRSWAENTILELAATNDAYKLAHFYLLRHQHLKGNRIVKLLAEFVWQGDPPALTTIQHRFGNLKPIIIGKEYSRDGKQIKIFEPMGYLAIVDYLSVSPSEPARGE